MVKGMRKKLDTDQIRWKQITLDKKNVLLYVIGFAQRHSEEFITKELETLMICFLDRYQE